MTAMDERIGKIRTSIAIYRRIGCFISRSLTSIDRVKLSTIVLSMENIVVCRNESDDDLNSIQSSESMNRDALIYR